MTDRSEHATGYFRAVADLAEAIDPRQIDAVVAGLAALRERRGRLFILGVGGGAGHAGHAVNDFRKLSHIESYAPTDNVSELTARVNDDGWDTTYVNWLEISRLHADDALLVFSVGGGSREHGISVNLVNAIEHAAQLGTPIYGIVSAPGGTLGELATVAILIDAPPALKTPLVESFQAIVWHAFVSHPELAAQPGTWESHRGEVKAAFLDRDGVLNELVPHPESGRPESPLRVDQVRLAPGAVEGALLLMDAGFMLVGVTNQPAVAKATIDLAQLDAVQERVVGLLADAGVRFAAFERCLHHPEAVVAELRGPCACRKPEPGMLLDLAARLGLDLKASWIFGDTDADIGAGRAAGCRAALVTHPGSAHKRTGAPTPDASGGDLEAAVHAAFRLGT